jgi:NAD-specific glutamate dehydrogenase
MPAIPAARQKLIERILASARAQRQRLALPVEPYVRQYFRGVAEEDLAAYPSDELAAAALAHLRSATVRKRGATSVRVLNADEARDGWSSKHTIVEVTLEDMPFLVDSLGMVLNEQNLTIHLMIHPVLRVRRDRAGRLTAIDDGDQEDASYARESWQHIQIDRIEDPARLEALRRTILRTFDDVRVAVKDWRAMRDRALEIASTLPTLSLPVPQHDVQETKELLEWLADNHFTFLGYREYRLKRGRSEDLAEAIPETGLGLLRPRRRPLQPSVLKGELREHARAQELLTITKANSKSTVHRATYLDYIGIKTFDKAGRVTGEQRFIGLFTSSVYHRTPARDSAPQAKDPTRHRSFRSRSREPRRQSRRARARDLSAR